MNRSVGSLAALLVIVIIMTISGCASPRGNNMNYDDEDDSYESRATVLEADVFV